MAKVYYKLDNSFLELATTEDLMWNYLPLTGGALKGNLTAYNSSIDASLLVATQNANSRDKTYCSFWTDNNASHASVVGQNSADLTIKGSNGSVDAYSNDEGMSIAIGHNDTAFGVATTTTPSSDKYSGAFRHTDASGNEISSIYVLRGTDGVSSINTQVTRKIGSSQYYNSIGSGITSSGTADYRITNVALFRNAIGLGNTTGAVPVANGGTGTTAKGTTLLSNIGITAGTSSPPSSGTAGTIYIQYT